MGIFSSNLSFLRWILKIIVLKSKLMEVCTMTDEIRQFAQWVKDSNNIVFFGGAGVSTESGIPDFRSVDGLYHQEYD